jgi:hypothetical protein
LRPPPMDRVPSLVDLVPGLVSSRLTLPTALPFSHPPRLPCSHDFYSAELLQGTSSSADDSTTSPSPQMSTSFSLYIRRRQPTHHSVAQNASLRLGRSTFNGRDLARSFCLDVCASGAPTIPHLRACHRHHRRSF